MPASRWKWLQDIEADRDYVIWVTYIPLRRFASTPRFLSGIWKVKQQLDRTEGLVGYALRAKPFRSVYWTLSVWESDAAVLSYTQGQPHRGLASKMPSLSGDFGLRRWIAVGSAVPPTWDDALARLSHATE